MPYGAKTDPSYWYRRPLKERTMVMGRVIKWQWEGSPVTCENCTLPIRQGDWVHSVGVASYSASGYRHASSYIGENDRVLLVEQGWATVEKSIVASQEKEISVRLDKDDESIRLPIHKVIVVLPKGE